MSNSVYHINKGINKAIEFRGLKAQYIWYLGAVLVALFILFAILYITGINVFACIGIVGFTGTALVMKIYKLSHSYGQYGMMKKIARKSVPQAVRSKSRKVFTEKTEKNGKIS